MATATTTTRRRPMTRTTGAVKGTEKHGLQVADVTIDLVRLPHREQGDASWQIDASNGEEWMPGRDSRQETRDGLARAMLGVGRPLVSLAAA